MAGMIRRALQAVLAAGLAAMSCHAVWACENTDAEARRDGMGCDFVFLAIYDYHYRVLQSEWHQIAPIFRDLNRSYARAPQHEVSVRLEQFRKEFEALDGGGNAIAGLILGMVALEQIEAAPKPNRRAALYRSIEAVARAAHAGAVSAHVFLAHLFTSRRMVGSLDVRSTLNTALTSCWTEAREQIPNLPKDIHAAPVLNGDDLRQRIGGACIAPTLEALRN